MIIHIAKPNTLSQSTVAAFIGDAIITGRTITDEIAGTIAGWHSEDNPAMARLANGEIVRYVDFDTAMLNIATIGDIDEGEAICLDFLDEWATLKSADNAAQSA